MQTRLPSTLLKAKEVKELARADTILKQLKTLQGKAMDLLEKAERSGDLRTALQGIREARGCLELLAKLSGELAQEGSTVNVLVTSPAWIEMRTVILRTLTDYPEAREAVTQALSEVSYDSR